jgi:glycosyltransferase involved in cell wall biosynthesis
MLYDQLFIAWVSFQRRALSIQPYFNYDLRFIELSFSKRFLRPLEYVIKAWKTLAWLIQERPTVVWIQLPPTLVLHILLLYKVIFDHNCMIVADCHNATFRKPWLTLPGFRFLLKYCDLVLVHNSAVEQQIRDLKLSVSQVLVLEDPPAVFDQGSGADSGAISGNFSEPWIICPCSFNKDEPIEAILAAARLVPDITFVLTGNKHRAAANHDISELPENVKLPGFLPIETFDQLLRQANVVMGLTLLDGIQLSVANEAVGVGKPMVLANTTTLRRLFYKGAVYIDPQEATAIAAGCREAIERQAELKQAVDELRAERQQVWLKQAEKVQDILKSPSQVQLISSVRQL